MATTNGMPPNWPPGVAQQARTEGTVLKDAGVTQAAPAQPSAPAQMGAPQADKPVNLNAGTATNIESAKAAPANSMNNSNTPPPSASQTAAAYKQAAEAAKPAQQQGVTMDR